MTRIPKKQNAKRRSGKPSAPGKYRPTLAGLRTELSIAQQSIEKLEDEVRGLTHQLYIIGQAFKGDIV